MPKLEPENNADALVTHIDECIEMKARPTKAKLEFMQTLAVNLYFQIERLENRIAYQERDSRETYRTIKVLQEAGLFDEDQYSYASQLVTDARSPNNVYTDVDTILKRNRADDKKHDATPQEGE